MVDISLHPRAGERTIVHGNEEKESPGSRSDDVGLAHDRNEVFVLQVF